MIVVANHLSVFDPLTLLHFLVDHGVYPVILAKSSLWRHAPMRWLMTRVGAIPVERGTAAAGSAIVAAGRALEAGHAVMLYPEGTTTRDPDLWPMAAKTGAARLALTSRVPVIPVAQWGAHRVIGPSADTFRPWPPVPSDVVAGPPVDLEDLAGRELDPAAWQEATERIMAQITDQLAAIRGDEPPRPRPR